MPRSSPFAPRVQCITFNESQDLFAVGLDTGLRVYTVDPLAEVLTLSTAIVGSVQRCALLHRTNLIALVGGGPGAKFPDNSLLVYDLAKGDFVLDITFAFPVVAIRLTYTRLAVALRRQLHLFSFPDRPSKLATFDTPDNPRGLCELHDLMVFPAHKLGSVHTIDVRQVSLISSVPPALITAHKTELACLATNVQGTLLATASVTGTIVRLFDLEKRELLAELRRGSDPATLYSIRLSVDSAFLCCASDKATVHLFAIKDTTLNRRSALQKVGILPCLEPLLDFSRFALPAESPTQCAFVAGAGAGAAGARAVVAVCEDGTFHKFTFALDGASARDGYDRFLDIGDDVEFWQSYKTPNV